MHVINARNVNDALPKGRELLRSGIARPSRYGDVIEMNRPVTTVYEKPQERVLFDVRRDANPFFHLMESLWILGGRSDVKFLHQFNKKMAEFSDDGVNYHAPYGARLRHFNAWTNVRAEGVDQLSVVISMLKKDPSNRRIVCSIWDPGLDLDTESKDIPCNDTIKFEARDGNLNMIVFCRSNDLVWGAYGANAVQFSMIQEYVAGMSGLPMGYYEQISCNFHGYVATMGDTYVTMPSDPYAVQNVKPKPLIETPEAWDTDLKTFLRLVDSVPLLDDVDEGMQEKFYTNPFFWAVAEPMYWAWRLHKAGRSGSAVDVLDGCGADDWRIASQAWLQRRIDR